MATISFLAENPELDRDYDKTGLYPFSVYNSETKRTRPLNMIVAVGRNNEIGRNGDLIWPIKADLRHFKETTMGHPVIMGRATWESLPKRPLPGRLNVVVSRNPDYTAEGAQKAGSLAEAMDMCAGKQEPFIIGGATLYHEALPYATRLYMTLVDAECPDADCHFPEVDPAQWEIASEEDWAGGENGTPKYRFCEYIRK